ncbi:hypothetical protein MMC22_000549 [Lobaria immixta]|nr:hypothetical protein [Lobaria immixta]
MSLHHSITRATFGEVRVKPSPCVSLWPLPLSLQSLLFPIPQPRPQSSSDPQSTPNPQPTPETEPTPEWEVNSSLPAGSSGIKSWNGGGQGNPRNEDPTSSTSGAEQHRWSFENYDWGQAGTDVLNAGKTIFGAGAAATGLNTLLNIYGLEGAALQLLPSIGGDKGFLGGN